MGDFLLEAKASAELYRQRQEAANRNNDSENTNNAPKRRSLSSHQPYPWLSQMVHSKEVGHGHHHHGHHHHKHHKNKRRPKVQHGTQHGMMIDAGSQGTRIHVYEFEARILVTKNDIRDAVAGRKLSVPSTDTRWTNRLRPGLDSFAYIESEDEMAHQVSKYLQPLFEFAQDVLEEKRSHWKHYPIYLKATGGLRTLPRPYRVRLIAVVRKIMHYKKFNPFFFVDEYVCNLALLQYSIYLRCCCCSVIVLMYTQNARAKGPYVRPHTINSYMRILSFTYTHEHIFILFGIVTDMPVSLAEKKKPFMVGRPLTLSRARSFATAKAWALSLVPPIKPRMEF